MSIWALSTRSWGLRTLCQAKLQIQAIPFQKPYDATVPLGKIEIAYSRGKIDFKAASPIHTSCQKRESWPFLSFFLTPLMAMLLAPWFRRMEAHTSLHGPPEQEIFKSDIVSVGEYLYFVRMTWHHNLDGSSKNLHNHLNSSARFLCLIMFPILRPPIFSEVEARSILQPGELFFYINFRPIETVL